MTPELIISVLLAIGLSAASGFRVFLPLFAVSLMSYFDVDAFGLTESFGWIGTLPAMIAFGGASLVELLAYYIPVVDNALDTIAIPLAAAAGTLISLSTLVDMGPLAQWSIAIIAGGGLAGLIKGTSATARLASTATTGGIANSIVSTAETGASILMTLLAIFLPVVGLVLLVVFIYFIWRWYSRSKSATVKS